VTMFETVFETLRDRLATDGIGTAMRSTHGMVTTPR